MIQGHIWAILAAFQALSSYRQVEPRDGEAANKACPFGTLRGHWRVLGLIGKTWLLLSRPGSHGSYDFLVDTPHFLRRSA